MRCQPTCVGFQYGKLGSVSCADWLQGEAHQSRPSLNQLSESKDVRISHQLSQKASPKRPCNGAKETLLLQTLGLNDKDEPLLIVTDISIG